MLQEGIFQGEVNELQSRALDRIIENSGYLNEQVDDLLRFVPHWWQFSLQKLSCMSLTCTTLLEQAMSQLQPQADAKGLSLALHRSPNMPQRLWGNSIRLQQIVINLGSNALKFTKEGKVDIFVNPVGDDAGSSSGSPTPAAAFPKPELANIFQPFRQLGKSVIHGQSGVGLGLTIVQELVQALGGKIHVESTLGQGSTFCVTLPLQSQAESKGNTSSCHSHRLN